MKTLVVILGAYVGIGWVVGLLALVRSRKSQFYFLESLTPLKAAAAAVAFWPLVLREEHGLKQFSRRISKEGVRTDWVETELKIPKEWIAERIAGCRGEFDWNAAGMTPEENPGMTELLGMMRPGDELWKFRSDFSSWQRLAGRGGYVLLRNGQQVGHLTVFVN